MWTLWILKVIIFPLCVATLKLRIKCVARPQQAYRHSRRVFCVLASFLASLFGVPTFIFLSDAPLWLCGGGGQNFCEFYSFPCGVRQGTSSSHSRPLFFWMSDNRPFCIYTAGNVLNTSRTDEPGTVPSRYTDSIFTNGEAEANELFLGPHSWWMSDIGFEPSSFWLCVFSDSLPCLIFLLQFFRFWNDDPDEIFEPIKCPFLNLFHFLTLLGVCLIASFYS